jgi:membrane dipeptidase
LPEVIDALTTSHPEREVFEAFVAGGVSCATVTCGFWSNAYDALDSIARWRDAIRDSSDLASVATTAEGIKSLRSSGRVAILLGFQNSDLFEDRIRYIELFADLGVRVIQLTYNNQNALGSGCYEPSDGGLARFGREAVEEMNRVGMLIDLSHVGEKTSLETIEHSSKPVAVTHSNPATLYPHRRNKSDDVIRALVSKGGVIGVTMYPNLTDGPDMSVDDWAGIVRWTVDRFGIDHVGIGSDKSINGTQADTDWMRMGRWTRKMDYGAGSAANPDRPRWPEWFQTPAQYPGVVDALSNKGFSDDELEKVLSGNWMRLYAEVFPG